MKGKVCHIQNQQSKYFVFPEGEGDMDWWLVKCACAPKAVGHFHKEGQPLPTKCPDCGNELEESTNLDDFK